MVNVSKYSIHGASGKENGVSSGKFPIDTPDSRIVVYVYVILFGGWEVDIWVSWPTFFTKKITPQKEASQG